MMTVALDVKCGRMQHMSGYALAEELMKIGALPFAH
jgi:hypothetical protein